MKKCIYILASALLMVIMMASCNKESVYSRIGHQHSRLVSISEAEEEVMSLAHTIDRSTKSKTPRTIRSRQTIVNTKTRSSSEISPVYYLFQFEDNAGFALASTDRRTEPVFCITENGEFSGFDSNENPGLNLALKAIDQYYRIQTGLPIYDDNGELVDSDDAALLFGLDPPEDTCEYYYPDPNTCIQLWQIESRDGAVLPTRWGQLSPFNHYCFTPDSLFHAPVGCVAIAVGQIMFAHQLDVCYNGTNYTWDDMAFILRSDSAPTDTLGWDLVQHLLSDLGRPENLDMQYGFYQSGASISHVRRTFNNFGYASQGHLANFDASSIKSWVSAGPVFGSGRMSGVGGHAWVFDEVITRVRRVYDGPSSNSTYVTEHDELVHINWGWNGDADGYYIPGIFNVMAGPLNPRDDTQQATGIPYVFDQELRVCHSVSPN